MSGICDLLDEDSLIAFSASFNSMDELTVQSRQEWRDWLSVNHSRSSRVWLVFYKQHTGVKTLSYDDAVEEALCFGWIDSIIRKLDEERFVRKFTPRKPNSKWSESNKSRVKKLLQLNLMMEPGKQRVEDAKRSGIWEKPDRPQIPLELPPELEKALKRSNKARDFFEKLAPSYQKQFIGWIATAKREETKKRRIQEAISLLEQNRKLGMK